MSAELRGMRPDGWTQAQVATKLHWSESKLGRIESGMVAVSATDLMALLKAYGRDDEATVERLVAMGKIARHQHWSRYRDVHSAAFIRYLGFEAEAGTIQSFQPQVMHGLLQTPGYAWALLTSSGANLVPEAQAKRMVEGRLERSSMLELPDGPRFDLIMDESVIRRRVGGRKVMLEQLQHVLSMSERPEISIRLLPLETDIYTGAWEAFTVLGFEDGEVVLYLEDGSSTVFPASGRGGPADPYLTAFARMQEAAASVDQSRVMVQDAVRRLSDSSKE
nr:helix-turn-helix transcriptional regulator [Kineosporia mesophila]